MSQDGVCAILILCTHAQLLVLVVVLGIYAVWGFGPSRGSPFSVHRSPPHPPPWPSSKVLWRGKGGQGRLCTPHVAGRSAGQPSLAQTQKTMIVMIKVKGPWSHGPCAPSLTGTYACKAACSKSKERQSLEGIAERRSMRPNKGGGQRVKARGFGVWMQVGHTHIRQNQRGT